MNRKMDIKEIWLSYDEINRLEWRGTYFFKGVYILIDEDNLKANELSLQIVKNDKTDYNIRLFHEEVLLREFSITRENGIEHIFYFEEEPLWYERNTYFGTMVKEWIDQYVMV